LEKTVTVIIGYADGKSVWIGADSLATDGDRVQSTKVRKVFKVGNFLIGACGSVRMLQLLQYQLQVPPQPNGMTDECYMVTVFAECVRECFREGGFVKIENNEESGGMFLVGYQGEIYAVEEDFQVGHYEDNVSTAGAGAYYALAAMYALEELKPKERILKALEVTEKLSVWVRGPFFVEKI
jgi:ATP-dependent protease HslVU (ClpYQ) peptidase subunit